MNHSQQNLGGYLRKLCKVSVAALAAATMLVTTAACGAAEGSKGATANTGNSDSLVVDSSFDLITLDPARSFETTAVTVLRAVYQSALKFVDNDMSKPQPEICTYTISDDNKVVTLTLNGDHYFADGKKVTVDDIVYSYQRVQGIQGNPSFYLDGVTVAKKDDTSLTLTSETPNPAIPYILPSVNLGIVEKSVVEANGGTLTPKDKADQYLNAHSAGSGPYQFDSVSMDSKVTLKRNPKFNGDKPRYNTVVMNNVDSSTELTNIKAGTTDIALSINSDEAANLKSSEAHVSSGPSGSTTFLWFNSDPQYGGKAADVNFVNAVRKAVNYEKYVAIYGKGSEQAYGMVPNSFLGALKSSSEDSYDLDAAKALLKKSGYNNEQINFLYSSDDDTATQIAQLFQSDMKALGVNIKLVGQPTTTRLDTFRSGKFQAGLSTWGADYPDPSDYFVFTPDQNISKRAGWYTTAGAKSSGGWAASASADAIMPLVEAAQSASGESDRDKAWQDLQNGLNQGSPFVPLVVQGANVVSRPDLTDVNYDLLNNLDLTTLK
ncbi:ABC transporter substrate-binding protein [Bifidobacterium sp.]|jgi:peptide/nickel transport system substrate-binding protein|uniref:ABC transporter substrate-binding protein n=1 Tax=Bifidobacterium sp. TaxID=41200 RepID=UPI0025C4E8F4|nr:ABC transporter substrate-binding protein [Bifidobacterium sp.]MCH4209350.1 ABC transporter substrate-binding protein [Bifidobacterium sp.]MCI1224144.1 ABC transporter substrate-binding protein [Bifidobacterium sp.]